MTKKIMMVAVLLGALTLGACVDNKESASVEAVRNAKAAQLNSIAAMNNAEAEVKKALAAFEKARAEKEQVQADKDKATLEADIATLKVEAEAALERAKADLEEAKAQLIKHLDDADIATKERVVALLGKANLLLTGSINPDRSNLISAKTNLTLYKAQVITKEVLNQKSLIAQEKTKAVAQALITEYEKYSQEDLANAEKAAQDAKAKEIGFNKITQDKNAIFSTAQVSKNNANTAANGSLYVTTLQRMGYYKTENVNGVRVDYKYDDGTTAYTYSDGYQKYSPNSDDINRETNRLTRDLDIEKAKLADAQKSLTEIKGTDSYKDLQTAVTDAQKEYNEATTEAEKNTARAKLELAERNLEAATSAVQSTIDYTKENIARQESDLKTWKENLAVIAAGSDSETAYNNLIDALVKSIDVQVKTYIDMDKAWYNHSVQNILASSLEGIANGLQDYATLILDEKATIARADEVITGLNTASEEQIVANQEAYIAQLENNLSVNEPIYQDYLKQIKALVSGE